MNLPNYFMADLPAEAELTAPTLREACHTLKRNRAQYLVQHSTQAIVNILAHVADRWLEPANAFRKIALIKVLPPPGSPLPSSPEAWTLSFMN